MKRKSKLTIAMPMVVLAALGGTAAYAQDEYSLKSPQRNRVLRLQGIRGLGGGLLRPD